MVFPPNLMDTSAFNEIKTVAVVALGNVITWISTVVAWQSIQPILSVMATGCSIALSLATILWIRAQHKAFRDDRKSRVAASRRRTKKAKEVREEAIREEAVIQASTHPFDPPPN